MTTFAEKVEILVRALEAGGVEYALGGAIALGYCTLEPRATGDIDVNVFVAPAEADAVFAALPDGVDVRPVDRESTARDGQVRVWWDETPIDLFFSYHEFHREVGGRVREAPFGDLIVRILDCTDLVIFKAIFGRSRDWADIESMAEAGTVDGVRALGWISVLLGRDSDEHRRLAEALVPRTPVDGAEVYRQAFGAPDSPKE